MLVEQSFLSQKSMTTIGMSLGFLFFHKLIIKRDMNIQKPIKFVRFFAVFKHPENKID